MTLKSHCPKCGERMIIESPDFDQMSRKEINEWKKAGGKMVLQCPDRCKYSSITSDNEI